MFSIIETGGKQYKVLPGQKIKVEELEGAANAVLVFDKILLTGEGDEVKIGKPYVSGAKVQGKVLRQDKEKTKIVFKYQSKTRRRKKKGHRQMFTEVQITKINE